MTMKALFHSILSSISGASFEAVYWDGDRRTYGAAPAEFVLLFRDMAFCETLLDNVRLRFGEGYMSGAIDVEGDLQRLARLMFLHDFRPRLLGWFGLMKCWLTQRWRRSRVKAPINSARHYEVGNDFFQRWLDADMIYSCAYFQTPEDDIDLAQRQKCRHVCAKLRLKEGEQLLDIGCGWGGFLRYAAAHHGVRGLGITVSREQQRYAQERIAEDGLADRIKVVVSDYRDLSLDVPFDKVVSMGMMEHVGKSNLPDFCRRVARLLAPGGIAVLHMIGHRTPRPPNPWLNKYVYSNVYFPTLAEIAAPLAASGLHFTDVEVLRHHYALTLDRWIAAFEPHALHLGTLYGEQFVRTWRLYLHCCAAAFRYGDYTVWQCQLTNGICSDIPLTRHYMYAPSERCRPRLDPPRASPLALVSAPMKDREFSP
jgi:cyclopropane-fatty-acyl-phospholipid synthase